MGSGYCRLPIAFLFTMLFTSSAWAGGFWVYEMGTPEMGVAEAGRAAMASDASTAFGNPAGMTRLEGSQFCGGLMGSVYTLTFDKGSETQVPGGGEGSGDAGGFLPGGSLSYVASLSPDWRFGLTLGSYMGGAVNYADNWYGRYFVQSVEILTFALNPVLAYRVTNWLSLGAGATVMYGMLKQKSAINNVLDNTLGTGKFGDGQIKIEDTQWNVGGNAGVLVEPLEGTRLGLTYRSSIKLRFEDVPELKDVGPLLSTILALRGLTNKKVDLGITIPQEVMFSACQELFAKKLAIMGSVGWQDWSEFGEATVAVTSEKLGKSFALQTKFQDTWHYAVGAQYRIGQPWLLSAGFAYDTSPFSKAKYRGPALPVDRQIRYAAGLQYDWSKAVTVGIAYTYLDAGEAKVDRSFPSLGTVQGHYSSNYANFVALNLNYKF